MIEAHFQKLVTDYKLLQLKVMLTEVLTESEQTQILKEIENFEKSLLDKEKELKAENN